MASSSNSSSSNSYAPSAPSLPPDSSSSSSSSSYYYTQNDQSPSYWQQQQQQPAQLYKPPQHQRQHHHQYRHHHQQPPYGAPQLGRFPPGTPPEVVGSFQLVDRDQSGFIDENELQQALSSGYQRFHIRTIRFIMFLFKNPNDPLRIGPREFAAIWSCLGQWRGIFERYDRDRSGKIDLFELRDALYGLGYAIPPSVLKILISKYDDGSGRKIELNFDSFVECGMIVRGLTEKFKEKDTRYTGSATFSYDEFMTMVIPFLVEYD